MYQKAIFCRHASELFCAYRGNVMKNVINEIDQKRQKLLGLFVSSIAFAFAISLIANFLCNAEKNNLWALFTGCGIILAILVIYIIVRLSHRTKKFTYKAGLVIDHSKKVCYIPRYGFSCDMADAFKYGFSENEGLKNLWNDDKDFLDEKSNSASLLKESAEYCLLENLSVHTTDYFSGEKKEKLAREYKENDLPSLIIKNRFIKIFSEPMENRSVFNTTGKENKRKTVITKVDGEEEEVVAVLTDDAMYHNFTFNLPKGAKITKPNKDTTSFDFKFFELSIQIEYNGCSMGIPRDFIKYYAGISDDWETLKTPQLVIEITIKEKIKSVFYPFKKAEYEWIDSFLNSLSNYLSFTKFAEAIGWNNLQAQLLVDRNKYKFAKEAKIKSQQPKEIACQAANE